MALPVISVENPSSGDTNNTITGCIKRFIVYQDSRTVSPPLVVESKRVRQRMKVLNLRFTFLDSVPPGLRLKTGKKKLSTPAASQNLRPPLVAEPHATSLLVVLTDIDFQSESSNRGFPWLTLIMRYFLIENSTTRILHSINSVSTAFFILIPASTGAGLITSNFLFGYLWFRWIQ